MNAKPEFPLIPGQMGLATLAQVHAAGWTPAATRHARDTIWQEPMPRVVAPQRGQLDAALMSMARWLWAGPRTVVTGRTALSWLGLETTTRGTIFLAPWTARAKEHGNYRVVRSSRPVERTVPFGIVNVAGGARAIVDAAVYEPRRADDLEHLTISLLQRGRATPEEVERELYARPGTATEPVWRGLEAFTQGAWSLPEKTMRTIVDGDGGYPTLLTNCTLEDLDGNLVGTPDGFLEEASTVIQVHSRQHHQGVDDQGGDRWARTAEKDSDYAAVGLHVVAVSPWTLYQHPKRFLTKLRKVVNIGLAGPRARVRVRG